jgi:serine protease inhibitor
MADYNKSFTPLYKAKKRDMDYNERDNNLLRSLDQQQASITDFSDRRHIDRCAIERDELFGIDTRTAQRSSNENKRQKNHDRRAGQLHNTGEITGEMFDMPDMEQGMPLRGSAVQTRRGDDRYINKYLDFNIYEKNEQSQYAKSDVTYNDPFHDMAGVTSAGISQFSDINASTDKLLPMNDQISPSALCSYGINGFNWLLFNKMQSSLKTGFCLSPFCLQTFLGSLYICAKDDTEHEIRSFCSFPDKNIVYDGLFEIFGRMTNKTTSDGTLNNILMLHPQLKINPVYAKYVSNVTILDKLDNSAHNSAKCNSINKWVYEITNGNVTQLLTADMLSGKAAVGINIIYMKPSLKCLFHKKDTQPKIFRSIKQRTVPMMVSYGNRVSYFEDANNQIIELDCKGNCRLGIILPKDNVMPSINSKYFNSYSENLETISFERICLPKFKQHNKFKLKTLLEQIGLNGIFKRCNVQELVQQPFKLDNIIHSSTFILTEGSKSSKDFMNDHRSPSTYEFIADHPFIYYLRSKVNGSVIMSGIFM